MIVVPFVLAACMMTAAQVLLARANPGIRLPLWGSPPRDPASSKTARGLAVGLALFGAINLGDQIAWWWGLALLVAALALPVGLFQLLQSVREPTQPVP
jgi:hypothetical protein